MKEEKPVPIRDLRIDDWVKIDGRPQQVRSFAAKLLTEDGEYFQSQVFGLELDDDDCRIITDKVTKYDVGTRLSFRTTAFSRFYLNIIVQHDGGEMKSIGKPVKYYHEVQHALKEMGCILGLNYTWKEKEKEDNEDGTGLED